MTSLLTGGAGFIGAHITTEPIIMAAWPKNTGARKSVQFKKLEILEKLPNVWVEK